MEDLQTILILVVGLLLAGVIRYGATGLSRRYQKRRARLHEVTYQARRHFVKAASFLAQAQTGKLGPGEAKNLAGIAVNEADLALELDPTDAAILVVKSLALQQLGRSTQAVKALDAALSPKLTRSLSNVERADTLTKRAELLLGQSKGRKDRVIECALADLQESVILSPRNPRAHLMLGNCYEKIGTRDKAEEAYKQVLVFDPSSPDAKSALERLQSPKSVSPAVDAS